MLRHGKRIARAIGYGIWRVGRRIAGPVLRPLRSAILRAWGSRPPAHGESADTAVDRTPAEPADPELSRLAGSRLVIAESAAAAKAAVRSGVPAKRVWLFVIPPERSAAGEPAEWATELRAVAPRIGGLVTDSLDAAGTLERVVGPLRTAVFPPIATDRSCPDCAEQPVTGDSAGPDPYPVDVPGHLGLWRALSDAEPPAPAPDSYPLARFLGDPALADAPERWTVDRQLAGARSMLRYVGEVRTVSAPDQEAGSATERLRVRIFGTALNFVRELADDLGSRPNLDIAVDEWRSAGAKNDGITENMARNAHVLVAEWARPNAIWLSGVKRSDQRLIVRLHRFEIETTYPSRIDIDRVDEVVYIAPHMGERIQRELGWPAEKLLYIPNYVDIETLDRPKYPDARFTLGMLGIVPGLKRFDLALDLLAALRREDPRFTLLIRSKMGWAHKPSWDKPEERRRLQHSQERLEKDPLLRGAVVFDAFGPDIASWFRKIGHILSLSDVEGSHQALTEGMASGAVPVLRGWDGAAEAYGQEWIYRDLTDARDRVLRNADEQEWSAESARAKATIRERFDPRAVLDAWTDLLEGRSVEARKHFRRL